VIVTMPESANFTVAGSTSADEAVRTDFPLKMSTDGGRQTLEGSVGHGGVQLQLETDHGNLELRKGESTTVSLTPPKAPAAPEGRGSTSRRRRGRRRRKNRISAGVQLIEASSWNWMIWDFSSGKTALICRLPPMAST